MPLINSERQSLTETASYILDKSEGLQSPWSKIVPPDILAYAAGLFDGEGCANFTVSGYSRTVVLRVMIRNTDYGVIEYLQNIFGGRIETKTKYANNPTWKPSFCWRLDWDAAVDFLVAIDPWVRIKSDQIVIAKLWCVCRQRRSGSAKLSDEYKALLSLMVSQMGWLNRKGRRLAHDEEPMEQCISTIQFPIDDIIAEVSSCH